MVNRYQPHFTVFILQHGCVMWLKVSNHLPLRLPLPLRTNIPGGMRLLERKVRGIACSLGLCDFINMLGITVDVLCWLNSHLFKRIHLWTQEKQETRVWSLGQEDPLVEEMASHSSILTWKIPWTEEPDRLKSRALQRVGHNWAQHSSANETNVMKFWRKRCK